MNRAHQIGCGLLRGTSKYCSCTIHAEDLDSSFSEPLDMLKAENKRLWEAINTLQRENLTIMMKLQSLERIV